MTSVGEVGEGWGLGKHRVPAPVRTSWLEQGVPSWLQGPRPAL